MRPLLRVLRFPALLAAGSLVGAPALADDYEVDWSSTFEVRLKDFRSPVDEDERTGFFDRYEFTRNKDDEPSIELALSELDLDLFGAEETPRLQFRLRSPTSDLGVSGGTFEIREIFLNQRGQLYVRPDGLALDVDYRRFRTDEMRLFRFAASPWSLDLTQADDRFHVRRGRVGGELRLRPGELLSGERTALGGFLAEIALRGGYAERAGKRQTRYGFLNTRTNEIDQEVTDGGAGLVFHPGGLFTMAVDFDHQRFREDAPTILRGATDETIAFVPDTDRTTGTVRLNSRIGARTVVHGALQISSLDQEGDRTPREVASGLTRNNVLFYSGNFGTDVRLTDDLSLNGFFKFDHRRNRIDRVPLFFDPAASASGQDYPFLKRIRRITAGTELVYRLPRMNRVALGARGEWVDRKLDFSSVGLTPANTMVGSDTTVYSAYLRTTLRPLAGLRFSGEFGYRNAPDTGYIRELDDVGYGKARLSYTFPTTRPLTLSLFGSGESGDNDDFNQRGPSSAADRDFEQHRFSYGATLAGSPAEWLTLFASVSRHQDAQDYDLWENPARFAGLDFSRVDPLDYRAETGTALVGGSVQLTEQTDVSLSYSFTRSNWRFRSDTDTSETIDALSRVRNDLHRAEIEFGHWLRNGLRVSAGYRFDKYRDRTDVPTGAGSAEPFNPSTYQHTILLGVTLNDDLLR